MADQKGFDGSEPFGGDVLGVITAFEQILEEMPNDREALETVAQFYAEMGDQTRACEYLVRLGRVLLQAGDAEDSEQFLEKTKPFAQDDAQLIEVRSGLTRQLEDRDAAATSEKPAGPAPAPADAPGTPPAVAAAPKRKPRARFDMSSAVRVAWNLMESEEITHDQYNTVVQNLTEMSASARTATVSLFHALEATGVSGVERIIGKISREYGTPIVSLANFDIQTSMAALLPPEFMLSRGVLVFERMGDHALIVNMNPHETKLRDEVADLLGLACHFFVTSPQDFDNALQKALAALADAERASDAR